MVFIPFQFFFFRFYILFRLTWYHSQCPRSGFKHLSFVRISNSNKMRRKGIEDRERKPERGRMKVKFWWEFASCRTAPRCTIHIKFQVLGNFFFLLYYPYPCYRQLMVIVVIAINETHNHPVEQWIGLIHFMKVFFRIVVCHHKEIANNNISFCI